MRCFPPPSSCYSAWTEVQNKSRKGRSSQTRAGRFLRIPGRLLWLCLSCIFLQPSLAATSASPVMKMCLSHLHILKLFYLIIKNQLFIGAKLEVSCIPGECPNQCYGEIPTFSFSLGLNSAMQSKAVSREEDEMALSQITIQRSEKSISKEGEKFQALYLIWSRTLNA